MRLNILRSAVLLATIWPAAAAPQSSANPSPAAANESAENQSSAESQFRISGNVVDGVTGVALARANVFISPASDPSRRSSTSSAADGRFAFNDLPPGKYMLSGSAKGYPGSMFQQHENFSTGVAVGKDLISANLVLQLFPLGSISGLVTDEFSDPVRNAQVMLLQSGVNGQSSFRTVRQAGTDDQGSYRFAGLQAGRYHIAVSAQPWYAQHNVQTDLEPPAAPLPPGVIVAERAQRIFEQNTDLDVAYPLTYSPREADAARATPIALQPGEQATADVSLAPIRALHVRLTAPGIDLSQNVGVQLSALIPGVPSGFSTQITSINKDYVDVAGLLPGNFVVNVNINNGASPNERQTLRQEITVSRNGEVALAELSSPVSVAGEIRLSPQTGPLQRAGLGMRNRNTGFAFNTAISPDGKFEFRNVPINAGLYDLTLLGAPGFYVDRVESSGAKASGRSVEIQGSSAVNLAVYVGRGVTQVEGVAQRGGKPVAGAMILLVPRDFTGNPLSLRRDQSDSDGTFMLPQVLPGSYTVVAIQNGWDQEWSNPAVIKTWLGLGETVDVSPNAKKTVTVNVQ
jgi:Carboxypeptidase regulatory-like domain